MDDVQQATGPRLKQVGGANLTVQFTVVSERYTDAYRPTYQTVGSAGLDLHACLDESVTLQPLARVRIPTGIAIQMPSQGVVGLIYARSGLAWRDGLGLPNGVGVIDSDYTGEIQVLLVNFGEKDVQIDCGDRIAQLVFAPIYVADLMQVETLDGTERGAAGFGSTGK